MMKYAAFPLAAVAAAGMASAQSPKWVPLNSVNEQPKKAETQPPALPQPAVAVVPTPNAPVAQSASSEPITAQSAPVSPAVVSGPIGAPQPLALTCMGAGTADKQRGTFLFGRYGWASAISHHDRQFNDQIDIRLFSGDDRIRLPRTMLPGIHGGQQGWFKLKDVVADSRSIHASAAVSAFHNPKVYIDRTTGTISISGKDGDYSGECQVIDANAASKF